MSIKSILVAYGSDAATSSGLGLALLMARKYDAHLTGVVWHGPTPIDPRHRSLLPAEVLATLDRREAEAVQAQKAGFESRVAAAGRTGKAVFLDLDVTREASLSECARSFDIVVMGRGAVGSGSNPFATRPDVVALRSGRPVLLVPKDYRREALNEHAVVAWDGQRAAARALGDAMHILETKDKVTVLSIGEALDAPACGGVMALLERHGIPAERLVKPAGRHGVGRTILDACAEVGAGLLVMGAYEHSKFSEDLLGGVTRDILEGAELPVLMAH
jgi:nucleotide-binding universal stress UspA family protein